MNELKDRFPDSVISIDTKLGETTVLVSKESLLDICRYLKNTGFNFLSDLTGVDLGTEKTPRFELLYHLLSLGDHRRLRLKTRVLDSVESVSSIWRTADWFEREIYDLLGVGFLNHPNLTRIYMPAAFPGHPLRKDYPCRGE